MKTAEPSITSFRKQMRAGGYLPIPVNGKIPVLKGWPKKTKIDDDEIERWEKLYPYALNTGLLTREMPTLDADILNQDASEAVEALVRKRFKDRGRILVRVGKAPKRAIPFRTDKPFEKITVNLVAPDGDTGEKLELLADGQQVVGFGIHEGTRKPYTWHGVGARVIKLKDLPRITETEARQLVDDAAQLLCNKFGYTRAKQSPAGNGGAGKDWGPLLANIRVGHELHELDPRSRRQVDRLRHERRRCHQAATHHDGRMHSRTTSAGRNAMTISRGRSKQRWKRQKNGGDVPNAKNTASGNSRHAIRLDRSGKNPATRMALLSALHPEVRLADSCAQQDR